jgi:hypothetical protein
MVVTTVTGQTSQSDPENGLEYYKSLFFELFKGVEEKASRLSVEVKNLTTVGAILEILHLDNGLKIESLKGREGLLKIIAQDDKVMTEVPGKILWATRNRDGDAGVTLGLELLGPLPLSVRHMLEANMSIGAKDMKVLWDYWDEIQELAVLTELPEPVRSCASSPYNGKAGVRSALSAYNGEADEEQVGTNRKDNWLYWLGFCAIISGLAMQFPQSEYLGFSGLIVMFLGSLMVAWKSILSMWQISSSGPAE